MENKIKDGIVSIDRFNKAKYKILWVLKEANIDIKDKDKHIDHCEKINNEDYKSIARESPTLRKVIYATYGILHDEKDWLDIPLADEGAYDVFKEIAYININKQPGGAVSDNTEIKKIYERDRTKILEQIKKISPQIIIFGGTEQFFSEEDLESIDWPSNTKDRFTAKAEGSDYEVICYARSKDRLIICPTHPAYFKISDKDYCTSIHNAVRQWKKINLK